MPEIYVPAGSKIYMQSAAGSAQVVSAISAAKPPVLTYVGADPSDNDYIALNNVVGMSGLEGALVKVSNVDTANDTFEMKDQDTTGLDAFVSGNMIPVTLDQEISVASGFTMSGGEQEFADYQYLNDKVKRKHPTTQTAVEVGIPAIWDPQDASMEAVRHAADTAAKTAFKIVFPNGLEILFYGYIGASGLPNASDASAVMTTDVSISVATKPRYIYPA